MGDYNAKRCTGSEDKMSSSFHFQKLFCKLSALYSCTCNGKAVVKSGADSVATSKQRTGSEKQRTGSECSAFRWFRSLLPWKTSQTIWSLTRLIVTNAPFSFLPIVLFACFGAEEWNPEEMSQHANVTSGQWSESPIILGVFGVEIISGYSYFILFRAAKK